MNNLLWVEGWRWNSTQESLTFFCCLVLAVLVSAGSPGTPWRHLTLNRAVNVAELGGVRGCTQTQVAVHWSHSYGRNEPQWVAHFHMRYDLVNCDKKRCVFLLLFLTEVSSANILLEAITKKGLREKECQIYIKHTFSMLIKTKARKHKHSIVWFTATTQRPHL